MSRVLDADLLFDFATKHETYKLLANAIADASTPVRIRILKRTMQGPNDEDDEHRIAYSQFNLLVWLTQAAPTWRAAQNALRAIKAAHPQFEARNRPDLDHEHWSGSWTPAVPITVDDWLQMVREEGPASGLDWIYGLDYSERQMDGPDWDGAQTLIRSVAEADPSLAVEVWDELVANPRDRDLDLRTAITFGWASTKIRREWSPIVDRAATLVAEPGQERAVADLAVAVAQDEASSDATLETAAALVVQLTRSRASSFAHQPEPEWMFLGLNSWPGSIARFWIQHVARKWREADYIMIRTTHTTAFDMMLLHSLRKAVKTIARVTDPAELDSLIAYLVSRGIAADGWLLEDQ